MLQDDTAASPSLSHTQPPAGVTQLLHAHTPAVEVDRRRGDSALCVEAGQQEGGRGEDKSTAWGSSALQLRDGDKHTTTAPWKAGS